MPETKNAEYSYTNLDEFEPDRGGPTPELTWVVEGGVLHFDAIDSYDLEEQYKDAGKLEAVAWLEERVLELQHELDAAKAVLLAAKETTTFVNDAADDEDGDED